MNELALFAGAGGGLLGSQWLLGWRTVCYVEIEPYADADIVARIKDGLLDDAPIWDDARTFDGTRWRGVVDIVTAGFPCQPFSVAGKRKGAKDERNLWPDTIRIICEVRPRYVLLENVPGLLADKYVRRIFGDLAKSGYDCRWRCLSAAEVGANHRRNRVWIVAFPTENGCDTGGQMQNRLLSCGEGGLGYSNGSQDVADTDRKRQSSQRLWGRFTQKAKGKGEINKPCDGSENVAHPNCTGQMGKRESDRDIEAKCEQGNLHVEGSRNNDTRQYQSTKNETLADTTSKRLAIGQGSKNRSRTVWNKGETIAKSSWWATEPRLGRVIDELANRLDEPKTNEEGEF